MKRICLALHLVLFFICGINAIDLSRYQFHTIPAIHYYHGILDITKDSIGRIWYNGRDALFMYDGNSFKQMDQYVAKLFTRTSWTYNKVFTDINQQLLVTTSQGLIRFNYKTWEFTQIIDGYIVAIAQEPDGLLWTVRENKIESFYYTPNPLIKEYGFNPEHDLLGIAYVDEYIYFADGNKIYRTKDNSQQPELFTVLNEGINFLREIIKYENDVFILTNPGLYRVNQAGKIIKEYKLPDTNEILQDAKKLYIDPYGILWIATQNGLLLLNPQTEEIQIIKSDPVAHYSIPHNSIWSVYPDPDGGIWIGTFGGKLAYLNFSENKIIHKSYAHSELNSSIVSCFSEDENGNIWVGTEGGGINVWNRTKDNFTYYTHTNAKWINYDLIKK